MPIVIWYSLDMFFRPMGGGKLEPTDENILMEIVYF